MQKNGLWQLVTGAPNGQWDSTGVYEYNCAIAKQCYQGSQLPSDCVYLDEQKTLYGNYSCTPSIVCPNELAVFTGDSTISVRDKSCYALNNNMKGVFFWALSGDVRNDDKKSLLSVASETFKSKTCLTTAQASISDWAASLNIRTEVEWQEFITKLQKSMMISYAGGIVLAGLFKLVDKVTDQLLLKIFPKANTKINQAYLYFGVKAISLLSVYAGAHPLSAFSMGKTLISSSYEKVTNMVDTIGHLGFF